MFDPLTPGGLSADDYSVLDAFQKKFTADPTSVIKEDFDALPTYFQTVDSLVPDATFNDVLPALEAMMPPEDRAGWDALPRIDKKFGVYMLLNLKQVQRLKLHGKMLMITHAVLQGRTVELKGTTFADAVHYSRLAYETTGKVVARMGSAELSKVAEDYDTLSGIRDTLREAITLTTGGNTTLTMHHKHVPGGGGVGMAAE